MLNILSWILFSCTFNTQVNPGQFTMIHYNAGKLPQLGFTVYDIGPLKKACLLFVYLSCFCE